MIIVQEAAWPNRLVRALTTTTAGGVSDPPWATFNLALHVGDQPAAVWENRRRLNAALALPSAPAWLNQIHGRTVCNAADAAGATADGSYAVTRGVVCAVLTADCLPIVIADRQGRCCAVLHGGWRGLAAGILEEGIAHLPVPPAELMVWLGPAIGAADYVVGHELREAFGPHAACAFMPHGRDHYLADLYALARLRLGALGVTEVYGGGWSTLTDAMWFSYRRQVVCGRMATLAWIL